jgi:integrase
MAEKRAAREALQSQSEETPSIKKSFADIAGEWFEHWSHGKSERYADTIKYRLEGNILPALGNRPFAEIQSHEVIQAIKAIEARGTSELAKRIFEVIKQIFRYGSVITSSQANTIVNVKPSDFLKSHKAVNFARVDPKELKQLLSDIEIYRGTPVTRLAMKLLALTFVRTSELIGAQWKEIDFDNARWDIPAERMKMDSPHIVPLSKQAIEYLHLLHTLTGTSAFLFPHDRDPKRYMSNNTILKALERMGYKGIMTGHGFRGLASTILHENDFSEEWIELQLAHQKRNKVAAAYNHAKYLKQRIQMMQWWADYLEHTLRGGKLLPFSRSA